MPQIPELALELSAKRNVIRDALKDEVAKQDIDPDTISTRNWNKAERHTIAGYLGAQLTDHIVEGHGADARFKNFPSSSNNRSRGSFNNALRHIQHTGANDIEARYTFGYDPTHNWYPGAAFRYNTLGWGQY